MRRKDTIGEGMVTPDGPDSRMFDPGGRPQVGSGRDPLANRVIDLVRPGRVRASRCRVLPGLVAAALGLAPARPALPQPATAGADSIVEKLRRIAVAEDARGVRPVEFDTSYVLAGLADASALVRQAAVRALGRLQDPRHAARALGLTADPDPETRLQAINAVGQSLQGLRSSSPADRRAPVAAAIDALVSAGAATSDDAIRGVAARTIGRLPHADSAQARAAEAAIDSLWSVTSQPDGDAGALHGLYSLARARRAFGELRPSTVEIVRRVALRRDGRPQVGVARVRRLALLTLTANGSVDAELLVRSATDPDEQVRRLVLVSQASLADSARRRQLVRRGQEDHSALVRHEAARAWRALASGSSCAPLASLVRDPDPHVRLAAIDGLGVAGCSDRTPTLAIVLGLVRRGDPGAATRLAGKTSWHDYAHALVSLARIEPESARAELRSRASASSRWPVRVYAARAATIIGDTVLLRRFAGDQNGNVRAAAIEGLSGLTGTGDHRTFIAALASRDYQVVRAAALALRGTPRSDSLVSRLLSALQRLTSEERENSRDPRLAIIDRLGEAGDRRAAPLLVPLVTGFDSTVAAHAAAALERLGAERPAVRPRLTAAPPEDLAEVIGHDGELGFTMAPGSGGGSFTVRLDTRQAPSTAARLVRLARARYFDGLTFHRVEPGFVIQGGSPGASEYVGDGPFMRDELGLAHHLRGTLGISTRGRDTGDAQVFVNLTDNYRLDHEYTVLGEIVRGRDIAERVLEGDVIARVEARVLR